MSIIKQVLLSAVLVCSLLCIAQHARAADIAFFPVETPNLSPTDTSAVGELLAQSYAAASGGAVLAPSRTTQTVMQSPSYEAAAQTLGVAEFVRVSAVGAGRHIVVTATRHRSDGTIVTRSKLIADSAEDLVPVCDRLAKALYTGDDGELVRTHQNVTLSEARPKNRLWRELLIGFKTGLHVPFARHARFSPTVAAAFDLRIELARFFLEFGAGFAIPTRIEDLESEYDLEATKTNRGSTGGLMGELGASYFLTRGDIGLYAGGGLQPKIMFVNDAAGMSAYSQLGVTLPRDSSTRFSADLRFSQSVLAMHLDNDRQVFPSELSLHGGVGW
jgi:hypothetical protein